ncbi:class II aldolase/adducin family protein [Microbacterium sp. QXD-8]|uniref:L-ribulose-5-phosphate 4-epimerase n=1 Tax=Microbacterium psychrotolerans TaxID=3068321 RepID=A0ABU0YXY8_9MICO|nr:class II aldolase/adducin family protein [Microbacterium sp. QXD-8]MDQ7876464.1 class II aldolase/adducin family protein [Microbacterium sp. QXD-8]
MTHGRDAELRERYVSGVRTEVAIARTRADVAAAHAELAQAGAMHAAGGAASGRIPGVDLFVISPAGIRVQDVAPENLVLCDFDGAIVEGTPGSEGRPSGEHALHARVYAAQPDVAGIVSSASPFASAWAVRAEEIPCVLSSIAEQFGGAVPLAPGEDDDDAGRAVAKLLAETHARAVLLRRRGVLAVGAGVEEAVTLAAFTEEIARIVHLAREQGPVEPLASDVIDRLYQTRQADAAGAAGPRAAASSPRTSKSTTEYRSKTKTSR